MLVMLSLCGVSVATSRGHANVVFVFNSSWRYNWFTTNSQTSDHIYLNPFSYMKFSHFSTSTSIICRRIDPYYHLTYLFWTNNDKLLHFSLKLYADIQTKGHLSFPLFKCRWLPFNWMKRDFYLVTLSMFKHMISLVHFFGEISSLLKY